MCLNMIKLHAHSSDTIAPKKIIFKRYQSPAAHVYDTLRKYYPFNNESSVDELHRFCVEFLCGFYLKEGDAEFLSKVEPTVNEKVFNPGFDNHEGVTAELFPRFELNKCSN